VVARQGPRPGRVVLARRPAVGRRGGGARLDRQAVPARSQADAGNRSNSQGGCAMGQSTEQLRRDIEYTRADMTETVDAIEDRIRPSRAIQRQKNRMSDRWYDVRDRVMGSASDLQDSVGGTAGEMTDTIK